VKILEGKWGGAINPEEVEKILNEEEFKAVTVVHSETSTGARNPIETIGKICKGYDLLYIVDAISSLGSMHLNMGKMNIDLCISASHKGIGGIVGLALVGVSDRAYKVMEEKKEICQSFALDLRRWRDQFFGHEYPRPYPVIASTHLVYALDEACKLIMEEGLENRLSRCRKAAEAVRKAMRSLGLELFPEEEMAADSLTAVKPPEGISDSDIIGTMREKYGVVVGGSVFELKGKLFRISHMGVQASMRYLIPTLAALERTLVDLGYKVKFGRGVGTLIEAI
jgi:aspartate aminotransferase-like enzyme